MRILVIRGGALGDFIVTLPMIRLLRERWPKARIELLGQPRLAEIALGRHYLDAIRPVDHRALSAFFTPVAVLEPEWMDYIGSFDLVLSYFFDPDELFLRNLERCRPGEILAHSPRVPEIGSEPAARHFARILEPVGLELKDDAASDLFPSADDESAARAFLQGMKDGARIIAVHPGSGSERKNWPKTAWAELGRRLTDAVPGAVLLVVEGEADAEPVQFVLDAWKSIPHVRARWLPLPILAAVLRHAHLFIGHDSGITHLAGACSRSLPVVALFGETDPAVWAPPRPRITVLRAASGVMSRLSVDEVFESALAALGG
jgi:heptosyltransferase-2